MKQARQALSGWKACGGGAGGGAKSRQPASFFMKFLEELFHDDREWREFYRIRNLLHNARIHHRQPLRPVHVPPFYERLINHARDRERDRHCRQFGDDWRYDIECEGWECGRCRRVARQEEGGRCCEPAGQETTGGTGAQAFDDK